MFYDHLAHRRFPVTVWIRKRSELDYLVEPDLFHDFFGHVPLLSNPVFADYMQMYGQRALEAGAKIDLLARLYWYTVEFGLIRTPAGLKIYGAGILSSAAEVKHAIADDGVERLPFEAASVMRRPYQIDKLQDTYFVLDDFRQLFEATARELCSPAAEAHFVDRARRIAQCFDSVSVCFSKGLGAPAGSALCGPRDFVARARRVRKMAGGAMRHGARL